MKIIHLIPVFKTSLINNSLFHSQITPVLTSESPDPMEMMFLHPSSLALFILAICVRNANNVLLVGKSGDL